MDCHSLPQRCCIESNEDVERTFRARRSGWHRSDRQGRFLPDGDRGQPGESGTALVGQDRAEIMLPQATGVHATRLHFDVRTFTQVDQLFRECTDRGVLIAEPATPRPWGMYEMRLHDPDGHVLRVSSPPPAPAG